MAHARSFELLDTGKPALLDTSTWEYPTTPEAHVQHLDEQKRRRRRRQRWRLPSSGWRTTVLAGGVLGTAVLVLNIALLAWAMTKPLDGSSRTRVLATGNCKATQDTFTWSHLAINVLSTILLGTSNAAMQCLSAPTRGAIDKAHIRMQWLDVGISSFRNWTTMDGWRKWCWIFLVFSSIPLHLLYNSAIFATASANEYYAIVVTSNYRDGNWTQSVTDVPNSSNPSTRFMADFSDQARQGQLVTMSNAECIAAYNAPLVNRYSNVVVVTRNDSTITDPVLNFWHHLPTPFKGKQTGSPMRADWICGSSGEIRPDCLDWLQHPQPDNWYLRTLDRGTAQVDHCLAQETVPQCTIQLVSEIMVIVIICNALKISIFFALVYKRGFEPLITLGDALDSFLNRPDPYTADLGTLSAAEVRTAYQRARVDGADIRDTLSVGAWTTERRRWFSGASGLRWGLTYALLIFLTGVGAILLVIATILQKASGLENQLQTSFGTVSPDLLLEATASLSPIGNVLVANAPQLVLSFVYLSYNGLFTCVLVSHEFAKFARKRQSLRVMQPKGLQRSSYFLSLPYRYALPLLGLSGFVHWTLSQSIFLAEVRVLDPEGVLDPDYSVSCLGYSSLALLISVLIGSVMLLAPVALGWKRFDTGAPIVESNSLAISAACHPPLHTSPLERVKYGAVDAKHACLFDGPIEPLVPGHRYTTRPELPLTAAPNVRQSSPRLQLAAKITLQVFNLCKLAALPAVSFFGVVAVNVDGFPALEIVIFAFSAISMLYLLARVIVDVVRWRKGWVLRRFAWHVVSEGLFAYASQSLLVNIADMPRLIWIALFAVLSHLYRRYLRVYYMYGLSHDTGGPAYVVFCSATLMSLWIASTLLETWLWWLQRAPASTLPRRHESRRGLYRAITTA